VQRKCTLSKIKIKDPEKWQPELAQNKDESQNIAAAENYLVINE